MTENHEYKSTFFDYINAGSLASARRVCPLVMDWLAPRSMLDVGCGAGAWCRVWRESGVEDVRGIDGAYVDRSKLLIPVETFEAHDLSKPFDVGRRYDLAASLEVAEHVAASSAAVFVDNLVRHSDRVLFSAAVPGQGGEFHVNEQPLEYWRQLFAERGYRCFDPLRPLLAADAAVEPWYRYNTLLYVAGATVATLPSAVCDAEIAAGAAIPERAPLSWRTRNAILRQLPRPALDALVKVKHAWGRRMRPHEA